MVNAQISHDRLDWGIIRSQKFLQGPVGGSVCDNEGGFVVVDFEPSFSELLAQFVPSCHDLVGKCIRVVVAAIKTYVVYPSIEMQLGVVGLERAEDRLQEGFGKKWCLWTTGCHTPGDMEPMTEFRICKHCFGAGVHLHGKLKGNGRVVQCLCHLLKFREVNGVIKGAHVQQDGDAVLAKGLVAFPATSPRPHEVLLLLGALCRSPWCWAI